MWPKHILMGPVFLKKAVGLLVPCQNHARTLDWPLDAPQPNVPLVAHRKGHMRRETRESHSHEVRTYSRWTAHLVHLQEDESHGTDPTKSAFQLPPGACGGRTRPHSHGRP